MNGERDAKVVKREELALEVLCIPGFAEDARSLQALLADLTYNT